MVIPPFNKAWFTPSEHERLDELLAVAETQGWRKWVRTRSDYQAVLEGCYFDESKARRFETFCTKFIRQVNGKWKGKPFTLLPWQWEWVIGPLFGWIRPDGHRRHRRAFVTLAKKNGKSALSSAIQLYMLIGDRESGSNCYCAALDKNQAKLVFRECVKFVKASPQLKKRLGVYLGTNRITFDKTYSFLTVLSADTDSAEGLDAQSVIYDELHMAKTDVMWDILRYAGSARDQSLFLVITTAGQSLLSICHKEYAFAKRVAGGEVVDTAYLACIFEAPLDADPADRAAWRLANPSLGTVIREEDLQTDYKQACEMGKMANFRRRRLNQWTEDEDCWISSDKWNACAGVLPANLSELPCWFGIDLGNTCDLNALIQVWKDDGKIYVKPRFWIPADAMKERVHKGHVFFLDWVEQGFIETVEGSTMDFDAIEEVILDEASQVALREIGYDQWQAASLVNHCITQGLPMVKVPQVLSQLGPATKELERLIHSKELVHDGNPVMAWCVANTVVSGDSSGNIRPNKRKSPDKIDGVVALVTALARILVEGVAEPSVYDLPESERVLFL